MADFGISCLLKKKRTNEKANQTLNNLLSCRYIKQLKVKDKILTIAIVIAIFCPIILFFFTSWLYALIIGNIFYSIICGWYLKISNKDYSKTKSIIFPLIFNFLGFAYTITKIGNAKNRHLLAKDWPNGYNSDVGNEAPVADEPNKEQKFHHHLQWLLKHLDELSDEIPLENQLNKNEKITVTLDNWLGTVSFKTTREKLYQLKVYLEDAFNQELVTSAPDYESISWEELRINNEFIIDGNVGVTGCCDPYLIFEPKGQFLAVDRWDIGYSFEFFNCKAPAKLEKYLFNEWMFFGDSNRALTKENDLKTMKSAYKDTEDDSAYVSNDGSAIIRLQDFDIDKFVISPQNYRKYDEEIIETKVDTQEDLDSMTDPDKYLKFEKFKESVKSLLDSKEHIWISVIPYKYDTIEKEITEGDNLWEGIKYSGSWDVIVKRATFHFDIESESINDFYNIIKKYKSLDELKGDDFNLVPLENDGGHRENIKIDWERPLTEKELKAFEKYGGKEELASVSERQTDDILVGRISAIEISVGKERNDYGQVIGNKEIIKIEK